jgi:hypothetical protein
VLCYHPLGDDYYCERGTVVEVIESVAAKGPLGTINFAKKIQKPFIHISKRAGDYTDPAQRLQGLLRRIGSTLNVAGSRESKGTRPAQMGDAGSGRGVFSRSNTPEEFGRQWVKRKPPNLPIFAVGG